MQQIQRDIAQALQVQPPFQSEADVQAQIARRIAFIQQCLKDSGLKTLVLGISGGVDSLTAGLLAQRAVEQLREQTGDQAYRFIAVRLPYQVQQDEADAQASLATIRADEEQTVNIGPSVKALAEQLEAWKDSSRRRATSSSAISRRASAWSPSTPSPAPAAAW